MARPVIDAHFHIYDPLTRPDITDENKFFLDDLARIGEGVNLVGSVHVEADRANPLYETVRCEKEFERPDNPLGPNGLVVQAAFHRGKDFAERMILQHMALSPRVKGVRQGLAYTSADGDNGVGPLLAEDPTFLRSFELLDQYDLSFDAWCYGYQIRSVTALASRFPNTPIILDHFGGPYGVDDSSSPNRNSREAKTISAERQEIEFSAWLRDIEELAERPNVFAKISGLTMAFCLAIRGYYDNRRSSVEELADAFEPYVRHTIEQFGFERCIWASNFPPDGVEGISYPDNFEAYVLVFRRLGLSDDEIGALLFDNAVRVYRLADVRERFPKENPALKGKTCSRPGCTFVSTKLRPLLSCSKCLAARYCSKRCQAKHWTDSHMEKCRRPKESNSIVNYSKYL